jgi:phosphate-selective porin OprO/OprP
LWLRACLFLLALGMTRAASAQQVPQQEPPGGSAPSATAPRVPSPSTPAIPAAPSMLSREELEQKVLRLEAVVNELSRRIQNGAGGPVAGGPSTGAAPDIPNRATIVAPSSMGGVGAPGQSLPPNPAPNARFDLPATLDSRPGNFRFGPGFELRTDDDEFIFQFHNVTQFEYRGYQQYGQSPVKDSFLIPRQWFMFSGRITRPIGYFLSLAEGFDTTNILDVFLDLEYNPRMVFRMGRYKTPFTYEFFVEPIQGLILPERSLFFNNFGQNRDLGVMAYGRLANSTLDYAVGIFNGARNGFVATSDSKFISSFVNWKPFNNSEGSSLENFNIGGSVFGGNETQLPVPQTLRTVVPIAGNTVAGVPFLGFNNNVRQNGMLTFWDLHTAWFYNQLAVIAEWQSGFQDYGLSSNLAAKTHLPVSSYYIEAGYMLTGETRSGTGVVKPRNPFNLKSGQFGLGAWELTGRYNLLEVGNQVFKNGLSDPNLWANRIYTTDLGFNWHINQYLKFMFDWEHAAFNQPVLFAPGRRQDTSDLFLARIQLYF